MTSVRCPKCNFVSFATNAQCKRCGAPLAATQTPPQAQTNAQTDRQTNAQTRAQTNAPRERASGPWRDGRWLVKRMDVPLHNACVKCSAAAVVRKHVFLKAYSAWSLLTHWVGFRLYYPINLEVPLCARHRFALMDKIFLGLTAAGLAMCALGYYGMDVSMTVPLVVFLASFPVLGAAVLYLAVRSSVVRVRKYKDPYLWLGGANKNYLEQLPVWPH